MKTAIFAKLEALRHLSVSCLAVALFLLLATPPALGQLGKSSPALVGKISQDARVFHTNGALWNSWDNLGNSGDITCNYTVPAFQYPGGSNLWYGCRAGYWIVAKSNTENGLVNAAGQTSTYLEGTTGEYVLSRGTIGGPVSEGWANPTSDYSKEPWVSTSEWQTGAGLKVVATRYSWSFTGTTNNYFRIDSPTEGFDFNDFILEDITLTYNGDLDGDGMPDANAVPTLDQVVFGMKADHDVVTGLGHDILDSWWDDDGVDYDEETFSSFEFDADRASSGEDDTGIDDPLVEWRGVYVGQTWIDSPEPQLFVNGTLMTFPKSTISHYWWRGDDDPANPAKRYAFATAVFNAEDEAVSTDFTFDPNLQGDLKAEALNPAPTDQRYMQAYGPWVMNKGETVRIVTAMIAGSGLEHAKNASRAARQAFNWNFNLPKPPPAPMMSKEELKVTSDLRVRVFWENPNEGAMDPDLNRADFAGYRIYRSQLSPQYESGDVLQAEGVSLPPNIDVSKPFAGNTGGPYQMIEEIPMAELATYSIGSNSYEYFDSNVILGFDYWYYVAAYDEGDPTMTDWQGTPLPNGLPSLESYRTMNYPLDPELGIPTSPPRVTVAGDAITSEAFEAEDPPVFPVPNPWRPGGPKPTVVFTGLPADATIKIFDVSGNLVQTIEHQSSVNIEEWDLLSRTRNQIVAGIYFYRVENHATGTVQFGKLMVIR